MSRHDHDFHVRYLTSKNLSVHKNVILVFRSGMHLILDHSLVRIFTSTKSKNSTSVRILWIFSVLQFVGPFRQYSVEIVNVFRFQKVPLFVMCEQQRLQCANSSDLSRFSCCIRIVRGANSSISLVPQVTRCS